MKSDYCNSVDMTDISSIRLSLRTLGTFNFCGHSLTVFVRFVAKHFLSSQHKAIRLEAVRTCCYLLAPSLKVIYF